MNRNGFGVRTGLWLCDRSQLVLISEGRQTFLECCVNWPVNVKITQGGAS